MIAEDVRYDSMRIPILFPERKKHTFVCVNTSTGIHPKPSHSSYIYIINISLYAHYEC